MVVSAGSGGGVVGDEYFYGQSYFWLFFHTVKGLFFSPAKVEICMQQPFLILSGVTAFCIILIYHCGIPRSVNPLLKQQKLFW